MPGTCVVYRLGLVPYQTAWDWQKALAAQVAAGRHPPALLLLEHPHTFTFGRRGQAHNLLWPPEELERRGVQVLWVDRGGDVTYHGPGQLVGYPILPLGGLHPGAVAADQADPGGAAHLPQADYVGYLRRLEQALILALFRLGVIAGRRDGLTGVWVSPAGQPAKIAAIGVKVDARGVSQHGFALNLRPAMDYWQGIVACGLPDTPATSLAALLDPCPEMGQVIVAVAQAFSETFDFALDWRDQIPFDIRSK